LYRFRDIASYLLKVADFNPTAFAAPAGVDAGRISRRSFASENEIPWAIVRCFLRDTVFCRFSRTPIFPPPICKGQTDTDRRTDRQTRAIAYTAVIALRSKVQFTILWPHLQTLLYATWSSLTHPDAAEVHYFTALRKTSLHLFFLCSLTRCLAPAPLKLRPNLFIIIIIIFFIFILFYFFLLLLNLCLQCFDAVGWAAGSPSGL